MFRAVVYIKAWQDRQCEHSTAETVIAERFDEWSTRGSRPTDAYTYSFSHTYAHVCSCTHTYTSTRTHVYICVYVIYVYIYIYTHT